MRLTHPIPVLKHRARQLSSDVHLPNPLDRALFTKGCFLHEGRMRLDRWS